MSIASQISRIQQAKADIKNAINSKGGNLTNQSLSEYSSAISALSTTASVDYYKCLGTYEDGDNFQFWQAEKITNNIITEYGQLYDFGFDNTSITPQVGHIYTQDLSYEIIRNIDNNLMFYAPLISNQTLDGIANSSRTGQVINKTGGTIIYNGECATTDGNTYLQSTVTSLSSSVSGTNQISLCFWCYLVESEDSVQKILSFGNSPKFTVSINKSGNKFYYYLQYGNPTITKLVQFEKWTHFALIYNNPNFDAYVNGVKVNNQPKTNSSIINDYRLNMFRIIFASSEYMVNGGKLKDVRLYNKALTQQEIQTIYNF